MGAVPSRESTSLFSYFRGSYEVGMVPLTKYYFGSDAGAAEAATYSTTADAGCTTIAEDKSTQASSTFSPPTAARDRLRHQLRQQLLLMRRDPAVLYANAREVNNVLDSLLHGDSEKDDGSSSEAKKTSSATSSPITACKNGLTATISPLRPNNSANVDIAAQLRECTKKDVDANTSSPDGAELKVLGEDIRDAAHEERLRREYWSVMPNDNFSERDLDHFLELVEETLFETNEAMLSADPIHDTASESSTTTAQQQQQQQQQPASKKTFLPVPCALCLAYPDGKERDGAFSLDGRVVNIIGYFGLMTKEMQDAFKVVKRIPTAVEKHQHDEEEEKKKKKKRTEAVDDAGCDQTEGDAAPTMYLNTAILTSAGDRTLERVLVLAAVMLRQQFHTVGRRHLLQAKLDQLVRRQPEELTEVDGQMLRYLQNALAIPQTSNAILGARAVSAEGVQLPYFDPLLEVALPSIPRGIYKPTHYINAATADPPKRQPSINSISRASFNGSATENSFAASASAPAAVPTSSVTGPGGAATAAAGLGGCTASSLQLRSLPHDAAAASSSTYSVGTRPLLYPQSGSLMNGGPTTPSAIVVPGSLNGSTASPPLLLPGSVANSQGGASGSFPGTLAPQHVAFPPVLPLEQAEEDAITIAFCRRMEKIVVCIETASNNYSALKSLTENFAFLHCQIVLDESLTHMELIDLPGLAETPSFKPLLSATTPVTTLEADGTDAADAQPAKDCGNEASDRKSSPRYQLSPSSAVVITLDPALVRQATMWASSFFHCPTRLPTGSWVKYKLKDECDQLRHVLQNKDMLIAHWRKSDADRAACYLGRHTGRLLEHVRALQAETEEARALPADYWTHRPLFVNQDGRKYALFQSRYGTMLIGVRAFSTSANTASALSPADRATAPSGSRGGQGGAISAHSNSNNNNNGHANSLYQRQGSANMSHTGQGGSVGGAGESVSAQRGSSRMTSSQQGQPFFMSSSGTYLPYMAPPPDAQRGNPSTYYGARAPLMVPQNGFASASSSMNHGGDAPHYYAHSPMMTITGNSTSYGSKTGVSVSYIPSSSRSGMGQGMLYRGGPPPPPPPPPPSLPMTHTSASSYSSAATMHMTNSPQFFEPNRAPLSAAAHQSRQHTHNHYNQPNTMVSPSASSMEASQNVGSAIAGANGGNVGVSSDASGLRLTPQSRAFGPSHSPSFFSPPQSASSMPSADGTTTTTTAAAVTAGANAQTPFNSSLWQSTMSPMARTTAHTPHGSLPNGLTGPTRVGDANGAAMPGTGMTPLLPASVLSPVPTVTTTATAHAFANRGSTSPQPEPLWLTANDAHAHSFSGLHNPPFRHTTAAASAGAGGAGGYTRSHGSSAYEATTGMASMFSAHSIWGPDPPQDANLTTTTSTHAGQTSDAAAATAGTSDHAREMSTAGDGLTLLDHLSPHSLLDHRPPFTTQTTGTTGPLLLQRTTFDDSDAAMDARRAGTSSLPWTSTTASEWVRKEDDGGAAATAAAATGDGDVDGEATPHYLLRGTETMDVDDEDIDVDALRLSLNLVEEANAAERMSASYTLGNVRRETHLSFAAATTNTFSSMPVSLPEHPSSEQPRAFLHPTATSPYIPMDPRIPTPPQSLPSNPGLPMYAAEAPPSSLSHSASSLQLQQQQQQQQHPSQTSSLSSHPPMTLAPNQMLYYTVANGVPMLVQPPSTPGGLAMAFPLPGPVTHGDPTLLPFNPSLSSSMQQQQQQQQQTMSSPPASLQGAFPFSAQMSGAQAMGHSSLYSSPSAAPNGRRGLHNPPPGNGSPAQHSESTPV